MADFLAAFLRELLFDLLFYGTGRLLLPVISFGRIKVAPLREPIGRARVLPPPPTGDIVAGEGWCKFAGFLFWAFAVLFLVHFVGRAKPHIRRRRRTLTFAPFSQIFL